MSAHIGSAEASSKPASAGDRAYEWIRSAILAGTFSEGQFLDEVALSGEVNTSRTPVREALHRLQVERFVDIVPRRGAQVRVVTAKEMEEVYRARFVIESHAIASICERQRGAPGDAPRLVEELEAAGRAQDWSQVAQLDQLFHFAIVSHEGNAVLAEMYDSLRPRQVRLALRTISTGPERLGTIEREHHELVGALDEHDSARSIEILRVHLRMVPELVRKFPG